MEDSHLKFQAREQIKRQRSLDHVLNSDKLAC